MQTFIQEYWIYEETVASNVARKRLYIFFQIGGKYIYTSACGLKAAEFAFFVCLFST
jgi:hypothetical protein